MDSNASSYLLNHATLPQVYCPGKEGDNIIELCLSLRVLQPETYHPSPHDNFDVLINWHQLHPQLKNTKTEYLQNIAGNYDDDAERIHSKQRREYVKVNMDGVIVGRKICILDHMGYSPCTSTRRYIGETICMWPPSVRKRKVLESSCIAKTSTKPF